MAGMVAKWPKKFPAFVASCPMNNVARGARGDGPRDREARRARRCRSARASTARPLDEPEFFPVFERAAKEARRADLDAPGAAGDPRDYVGEQKSKYEIWQVLGWPFETSVAMSRMVFSGLFEKLPGSASSPTTAAP